MESKVETNNNNGDINTAATIEANRLIKEFEKRAKEAAEQNGKNGSIPSKTTRLIEKFEKKAQGVDDGRRGSNGTMVNSIKKVFEPININEADVEAPEQVIPAGQTNKLIGMFQPLAENQD